MYAVIETGGKQYRVEVGTELEVELLDVAAGDTITLDRVLLVADGDEASIGRPLVANAAVSAEVVRQDRGPKLISFKYRPKARSRVKKGHRQELTVLRISDIVLDGKSAAKASAKAAEDAKTERMRLEEAAAKQAAADAALAAKLAVGAEPKAVAAEPKKAPATKTTAKASAASADAAPAPETETAPAAETETAPAAATETAPAAEAGPAAAAPKKATRAKAPAAATDEENADAGTASDTKKDE
jgi:large subunit ribosomal protein L21